MGTTGAGIVAASPSGSRSWAHHAHTDQSNSTRPPHAGQAAARSAPQAGHRSHVSSTDRAHERHRVWSTEAARTYDSRSRAARSVIVSGGRTTR